MIPVFRPSVTQEEIDAVTEVLRSGWWGLGPKTKEFENAFAAYVGTAHAVGMNSATAALELALGLFDVAGGEVITTPMTFVSTNHAIVHNGATPVFADIEPDTLNIDPVDVERKMSPRTRAIMVVHYGGHPVDLDRIRELAASHGIPVIEDAAHAAGAEYHGRKIGSISEATCFSFHAVKNLAMGEGGAVTVATDEHDKRLRQMRWLGITKDTWSRSEDAVKYSWFYSVEDVGFKAHLSDIPAAIGLVQLRRLDANNAIRRRIAQQYTEAFADLDWVSTPVEKDGVTSAWHNYVIKAEDRDDLIVHLQQRGIAAGMHYIPNHLYRMYEPYYVKLEVTESVWTKLVTLPLFPDLTPSQIDQVVDGVRSFQPSTALHAPIALPGLRTNTA